ncbi:hypothetical protein BMW23_0767 [Bodo saltans virus]|uniref:Uncharacterized protein n=1 Tax=Bodo saltans virus TaxID=2024608 RepID=A0A2H4UV61_9VIRU|nr:hypothetical protein QJ851_gp0750 [Bodo saltans virus]ATZ80813.1 hypothetical protein BMW23_0767 [Bodo saltans virus]
MSYADMLRKHNDVPSVDTPPFYGHIGHVHTNCDANDEYVYANRGGYRGGGCRGNNRGNQRGGRGNYRGGRGGNGEYVHHDGNNDYSRGRGRGRGYDGQSEGSVVHMEKKPQSSKRIGIHTIDEIDRKNSEIQHYEVVIGQVSKTGEDFVISAKPYSRDSRFRSTVFGMFTKIIQPFMMRGTPENFSQIANIIDKQMLTPETLLHKGSVSITILEFLMAFGMCDLIEKNPILTKCVDARINRTHIDDPKFAYYSFISCFCSTDFCCQVDDAPKFVIEFQKRFINSKRREHVYEYLKKISSQARNPTEKMSSFEERQFETPIPMTLDACVAALIDFTTAQHVDLTSIKKSLEQIDNECKKTIDNLYATKIKEIDETKETTNEKLTADKNLFMKSLENELFNVAICCDKTKQQVYDLINQQKLCASTSFATSHGFAGEITVSTLQENISTACIDSIKRKVKTDVTDAKISFLSVIDPVLQDIEKQIDSVITEIIKSNTVTIDEKFTNLIIKEENTRTHMRKQYVQSTWFGKNLNHGNLIHWCSIGFSLMSHDMINVAFSALNVVPKDKKEYIRMSMEFVIIGLTKPLCTLSEFPVNRNTCNTFIEWLSGMVPYHLIGCYDPCEQRTQTVGKGTDATFVVTSSLRYNLGDELYKLQHKCDFAKSMFEKLETISPLKMIRCLILALFDDPQTTNFHWGIRGKNELIRFCYNSYNKCFLEHLFKTLEKKDCTVLPEIEKLATIVVFKTEKTNCNCGECEVCDEQEALQENYEETIGDIHFKLANYVRTLFNELSTEYHARLNTDEPIIWEDYISRHNFEKILDALKNHPRTVQKAKSIIACLKKASEIYRRDPDKINDEKNLEILSC